MSEFKKHYRLPVSKIFNLLYHESMPILKKKKKIDRMISKMKKMTDYEIEEEKKQEQIERELFQERKRRAVYGYRNSLVIGAGYDNHGDNGHIHMKKDEIDIEI